jgi:hypothetical protein
MTMKMPYRFLARLVALIVGACMSLASVPTSASEFAYKDWRFDTDAVEGPLPDAVIRSLQAQIDIVENLNISPDIKAFFRHVSVKIEPSALGFDGFYRARETRKLTLHRIVLSARAIPPEKPVLLRLLLFDYVVERVPNRWRKTELVAYFNEAKRWDAFPNRSEMMSNPAAFLSRCATVVMLGHVPDGPTVRADVREKLPDFYDWIVKEFYPAGVSP